MKEMKTKILTSVLTLLFSVSISAQAKKDYGAELDLIFEAFKEQNYELMKPLLDENVKIGDLPTGMNDVIVPQIIEQFPIPTSYEVIQITEEEDNTHIETSYDILFMEMTRSFTFNKDGKIIELDILKDVITETKQVSGE